MGDRFLLDNFELSAFSDHLLLRVQHAESILFQKENILPRDHLPISATNYLSTVLELLRHLEFAFLLHAKGTPF